MDNQTPNNDKLESSEIKLSQKSKIAGWLDNFWFHYKWPVIIGSFFLIVLVIGIVQIVGKTDNDTAVTFAGPSMVTPNQAAEIERELSNIMPEDYNRDGEKIAHFLYYSVYSEDEIKEANEAATLEDGRNDSVVNTAQNATNKKDFDSYVNTGDCSIYFVSESLYENFKIHDRARPLSELFGEDLPVGTLDDGYGIRLGDLEIYKLDAFGVLDEDTVVCLIRPYLYGESSKDKIYQRTEDYFKAIVEFGQ